MTFDIALRLIEILIAFAFIQQSLEYFVTARHLRPMMVCRIILCIFLLIGFQISLACLGLFIIALMMLHYFQGPYNGGSDRMGLLVLTCLTLIHFLPSYVWREYIFGYLAVQLILSYVIAGWVKLINPDWRNGRALQDVFKFSTYPMTENTRRWATHPKLLLGMSWAVIGFELLFPLVLFTQTILYIGLAIALIFHLANACLFGFNRFVWIWVAAYPSIIWLQFRVLGG